MPDNKLQSLNEIFNQKLFRIPDFQRGYSWGEDQLNDFWEDIENLKESHIHYTGLLTVEQAQKKDIINKEKWQDDIWLLDSGINAYYVIDGQQRLTTSIVLLNEILKFFDEAEGINFNKKGFWEEKFLFRSFGDKYKSFIFGYEKDNPSDEYFKTKILGQRSSKSDKVPEQTLYTSNLSFAKKYFQGKLKNLDKNQIEDLFRKVINRFKFNFYEIDNELDIYVTFETMNNRGKPLSNLELLKNRLIYLSTLLPDDAGTKSRLRDDINETWKTIYEHLGKNKDNPLGDDDFLFNHWIMYFRYDRKESASYAKFLLNEKFTAKNTITNKVDFKIIKAYIDSLADAVKSWFHLFNVEFSSYSADTREWIQKVNRIGMSGFAPLIMATLVKEKEESKVVELLKAVEQYIFLVFKLSKRPTNTNNSHFYRLSSSYYHNNDFGDGEKTTVDKIIGNVKWMTAGESGEGEDYQYFGWFDLKKFQIHLKELFDKESGFYSWNGIRYFLYEYELHLQNLARGNEKISWTDFDKRKKEDSIEHIYPQTPDEECWQVEYKKYNKKQRAILLHSLGNLVLISQTKNSEIKNNCFGSKVKYSNKNGDEVGFFNGSYSEIEVATSKDWTPREILLRGIKMMRFMERRWDFKIEDWEETSREGLLSLEFVEIT